MSPMSSAGQPGASALRESLWAPWQWLASHPPFSWLVGRPIVRLVAPDGSSTLWDGTDTRLAAIENAGTARFVALEMPPEDVLWRSFPLPDLPASDIEAAARMEALSASPFESGDLVWGHAVAHAPAPGQVHVVLASRRAVARVLDKHLASVVPAGRTPEVWALGAGTRPVVLKGYGETARHAYLAWGRRLALALLALSVVIASAAALTPLVQATLKLHQARLGLVEMERLAAPALARREALLASHAALSALREQMNEHVDVLAVVDLITQLVPDDTWLQRLQYQGGRVSLAGQTANTAALMNALSRHPGVREVKAPVAATRALGGQKENFQVEFVLLPEALRVDMPRAEAVGVSDPAVPVLPSASGPVSAAAMPAVTLRPVSATITLGTSSAMTPTVIARPAPSAPANATPTAVWK